MLRLGGDDHLCYFHALLKSYLNTINNLPNIFLSVTKDLDFLTLYVFHVILENFIYTNNSQIKKIIVIFVLNFWL